MMNNCIIILLISLMSFTRAIREELTIETEMLEETQNNTRIDSMKRVLQSLYHDNLSYVTVKGFFKAEKSTGDIKVVDHIDLESLCSNKQLCCGTKVCIVEGAIVVSEQDGSHLTTVKLKVKINDQNDNKPKFTKNEQEIKVKENLQVGKYIPLEQATDADKDPSNKIKKYSFNEPTDTFRLDQTMLPDIQLVLQKPLDRERNPEYAANLEACDIGTCTRQNLKIKISDVNDNKPRFSSRQYTKKLKEDVKVGSYVLELKASDPDYGINGQVMYAYSGQVDDDIKKTFDIEKNTGKIRLKNPLAANIRSSYSFSVKACDEGVTTCNGVDDSVTKVDIAVEDINNFPPSIKVIPSANRRSNSGEDIELTENERASQIAMIRVEDKDLNENARVTCRLDENSRSNGFILSGGNSNIYQLRTDKQFDYEQQARVSPTITCSDHGQPTPMTATRIVKIKIKDVNEFRPSFSENIYNARVLENSGPGVHVITVVANDRDGASILRYSFGDSTTSSLRQSRNDEIKDMSEYFTIDERQGIIRTSKIPLDRETISQFPLVVQVTDSDTEPIFTATTTINVQVRDVNDNAPRFINPQSEADSENAEIGPNSFKVMENIKPNSLVSGVIEADDPDEGPNGDIDFRINATWALKMPNSHMYSSQFSQAASLVPIGDRELFRLTLSKELEVLHELDREEVPAYVVELVARDRGQPSLSTTTRLRVHVLDDNDNAPEWSFPRNDDRQINFTSLLDVGERVTRLQAKDNDTGLAGTIEYLLLDTNGNPQTPITYEMGMAEYLARESGSSERQAIKTSELKGYRAGPFYLNGTTGEIFVATQMQPGTVNLRLRAQDLGIIPLKADAWLNLYMSHDASYAYGIFNWGTLNVTIILAMIGVTAVISLLLIAAIVCVRRRPARAGQHMIDYTGGMAMAGAPGSMLGASPYLDAGKDYMGDGLHWSSGQMTPGKYIYSGGTGAGTPVNGGAFVDENGQLITTATGGMLSYGPASLSPSGIASDTTSMIFMPNSNAPSGNTGMNIVDNEYQSGSTMHTFGTLTRNGRGNQKLPVIGLNGFEAPVDADSGDSGRGPSEEGNQLLLAEAHRNGNGSGYVMTSYGQVPQQYGHYRPSSRSGYPGGATAVTCGNQACLMSGGPCSCYVVPENGLMQLTDQHGVPLEGASAYPPPCYAKGQSLMHQPPSPAVPRSPRVGSTMTMRRVVPSTANSSALPPAPPHHSTSFDTGSLPRNATRRPNTNTAATRNPANQPPIRLDLRTDNAAHEVQVDSNALPPTGRKQPSELSNGSGEYEGQADFSTTTSTASVRTIVPAQDNSNSNPNNNMKL